MARRPVGYCSSWIERPVLQRDAPLALDWSQMLALPPVVLAWISETGRYESDWTRNGRARTEQCRGSFPDTFQRRSGSPRTRRFARICMLAAPTVAPSVGRVRDGQFVRAGGGDDASHHRDVKAGVGRDLRPPGVARGGTQRCAGRSDALSRFSLLFGLSENRMPPLKPTTNGRMLAKSV